MSSNSKFHLCNKLFGLTCIVASHLGRAVVDKKYTDVIKLTLLRERRAELDEQEKMLEASVRRAK